MNVTLPGIMAQAHAQPRRPLWPWSLVLGLQTHGTSSELIFMPRAPAAAGGETESQNWRLSMQVRMRVRVHLHKKRRHRTRGRAVEVAGTGRGTLSSVPNPPPSPGKSFPAAVSKGSHWPHLCTLLGG